MALGRVPRFCERANGSCPAGWCRWREVAKPSARASHIPVAPYSDASRRLALVEIHVTLRSSLGDDLLTRTLSGYRINAAAGLAEDSKSVKLRLAVYITELRIEKIKSDANHRRAG